MTGELAKWGEDRACQELKNKGHFILSRNFRNRAGEIDIISKINELIVITEVKTRTSRFLSSPTKTISLRKQRTIINVANNFLRDKNIDLEVRFDIVTIIKNSVVCEIEHLEGAFYPNSYSG